MSHDEDGPPTGSPSDGSAGFGPIDAGALREIRDRIGTLEPLVERASLDDQLDPQALAVELSDGVGDASIARFDVRWSLTDNYAFHYTDDRDRNFRFDRHPKPEAASRHFHPPPDAASSRTEPSCIVVTELWLVVRAVLKRWRYAYEHGTFEGINDAQNPP